MKHEPELSLLIIDLGDSCVVKVENAENGDNLGPLYLDQECINATTLAIRSTFAELRAALDADSEPPASSTYQTWRVHF